MAEEECPNCGAAMRIIALIDEPAVIKRILYLSLFAPIGRTKVQLDWFHVNKHI